MDPDQLASKKPADLDLQFSKHDINWFSMRSQPIRIYSFQSIITGLAW